MFLEQYRRSLTCAPWEGRRYQSTLHIDSFVFQFDYIHTAVESKTMQIFLKSDLCALTDHDYLFKVTHIWHQWEQMYTRPPHLQHACCWIKDTSVTRQTVIEMNTKEMQVFISWIGGCGNSSLVTDGQLLGLRARSQKISSQWFFSHWACSVTT